jgi:hypothetical protein
LGDSACFITEKSKTNLFILFAVIFVFFTAARVLMPYPKMKTHKVVLVEKRGDRTNIKKVRPEDLSDSSDETSSEYTDPGMLF